MKLKNISVVIMVALGVVACGGSDNNEDNNRPAPVDPPPQPQPETKPEPQPEARNDDKTVDPTGTKVVDGRDLSKESTVGGLQYIRRDSSDYDRIFNPDKMASATPLLGVGMDTQNPKLTNIVLARRDLMREDNKAVRAQFAGAIENEPLTSDGKPRDVPSLQVENFKNVDILAGAFKQVGSADFGAADNRLGADHNIDTHIQNNVDKKGEFTRERVAHVYTLRYEYQQPYVDYPHASLSDLASNDPEDPKIDIPPPSPPDLGIAEWERRIIGAGSSTNWLNAPRDPGLWPEGATQDNVYGRNLKNNTSRHMPNIGVGPYDALSKGYQVENNTNAYGSLADNSGNPVNSAANAEKWHNVAGEPWWDWVDNYEEYKKLYHSGAYPRYISILPRYQNWRNDINDKNNNPGNPLYIKGQPRYPNEPYDVLSRIEDTDTSIADNKTHRHTFLDREDFTAVRAWQPIRPLRNPVPNTWTYTLNENWEYWEDIGHGLHTNWVRRETGAYTGHTTTKTGWKLLSAHWTPIKNEGDGVRGEFRGPAYVGWHQDDRAIRFADDRIWKAGASGYKQEYERKYGANLIWWSTQDSAFENWATLEGWNPRARRVDNNVDGEGKEDLLWGAPTGTGDKVRDRDLEIQPTGDITNGLIRIGGTDRTGGKLPTLGQEQKWAGNHWEDHHKTSTRIFGHYHLAYADQDERTVQDMGMNSYLGARSFVAKVKDKLDTPTAQGYWANLDSQPVEYSIGAEPITLKKVQYGRVTSQLDLSSGEGPFGDGFLRAPFAKKGTQDSVDNYFFRGIDATSVADMPKEGSATYKGHALMYGINNDFHGITGDVSVKGGTRSLPNAFAGVQQRGNAEIGLGNFVEANVDFATRKVKGDVYNAWLVDVKKANVVHDKLVAFEGDITGNTVLGKADRTYIPGNDEADFRAAFFGKEADEMGGSFNSVKPDDKYGSAYEYGDWGGAFGAKKIGTNTFQGDDGANLYGNSNTQQNNYGP